MLATHEEKGRMPSQQLLDGKPKDAMLTQRDSRRDGDGWRECFFC